MNTPPILWWILLHFSLLCHASTWIEPDLSSYTIVHPLRANSNGQKLSNKIDFDEQFKTTPKPRLKRKINPKDQAFEEDPEEKFYVVINNDQEEILLELTPNRKLVTPFTVIEWVLANGESVIKKFSRNCFYYGKDVKTKGPSLVAVSNCDGLTGYIQTNNESYFIEPLTTDLKRKLLQQSSPSDNPDKFDDPLREDRLQNEISNEPRPHVIYKVKTILNKLNLSIQTDQNYDHFEETLVVDPIDDSTRSKAIQPDENLNSQDDAANLATLFDPAARSKRSTQGLPELRHLKGGKRMGFLSKKKFEDSAAKKKKKKKNICKKMKISIESEDFDELEIKEMERICKAKRERRAKRKELKEKRALAREKRREERRRRKEKRRRLKGKLKGKRNHKQMQKDNAFHNEEETSVVEPLENDDWQGYSPDLLWDTQIAAARSGLNEVILGDPINQTDAQKWLELTVGIDHSVIDFHGEKNVEKYILTLFNIVSAIYEDPSLEANLQIVLLRLIFYKDQAQSQVKKGLAKKSLEAVNRWADRLHKVSPKHLKHDLAVWLTRYDLGGPSGYAPVSGVCEPSRSCTLNRDEGLTSAFIIAHEMGHVLGMSHDGDPEAGNNCETEGILGSVMAPLVAATFGRFHWSRCSKSEYHYLSLSWDCLLNQPQWDNATQTSSNIENGYSLDDQCRMEFGTGYALCKNFGPSTDPCTFLWCSNTSTPSLCKTKKGPPLEGTICGVDKWCRRGYCESITGDLSNGQNQKVQIATNDGIDPPTNPPVRHNPQHGGWSPWSDWGSCSRTCGTGISFRVRACDSPEPKYGGRICQGKREEWKVCSTEVCSDPGDIRAQQCEVLEYLVKLGKRRSALTWQPYEPVKKRKKCKLTCYSQATNEVYVGKEFLLDGTPCSYEDPDDICVQGKCISMGCDKKIGSSKKTDQCGVCGGFDKNCRRHNFIYKGNPARDYTSVTVLPKDSWKISISEESPTGNFLSIRNNKSEIVLNSREIQGPAVDFIVEGAMFHYIQKGEHEFLMSTGPLLKDITLLIHGGIVPEPVTLTTTYLTQENPEIYKWELGPLSGCSATCGGGVRFETLICRNRKTNEEVSHVECDHLPMPKADAVPCNQFGCTNRWITDPWESCTQTCGDQGMQHRQVSCVRVNEMDEDEDGHTSKDREYVDPMQCADQAKPESQRPCNRKPCPAYWKSQGWTDCSVTCGAGEQEHIYRCEGDALNEVTSECGTKPTREMRTCFKDDCPTLQTSTECVKDKSHFCQLPSLYRYCKIPKYRLLCCRTCAKVIPFT